MEDGAEFLFLRRLRFVERRLNAFERAACSRAHRANALLSARVESLGATLPFLRRFLVHRLRRLAHNRRFGVERVEETAC